MGVREPVEYALLAWVAFILLPSGQRRNPSVKQFLTLVLGALMLGGCSSIYYKHPETGTVAECEPELWKNAYPGAMYVKRYQCGKRLEEQGYVEVEKCKDVPSGTLCISKKERREMED